MAECEVFLCVDNGGDYGVGNSAEAAREDYESKIQSLNEAEGFRIVRCVVKVPLPEMVELTGTAPALGAAALNLS